MYLNCKSIISNPFWNSVATLSFGQIIAQLINIFSIPIISRLYSQEAYGDFGLLVSIATIIIGVIGLGLGSAIMVPEKEEESKLILQVTFLLQIILSFLICLFLPPIINYKFIFYKNLTNLFTSMVLFLYITLTVLSSLLSVYINRLRLNKILFKNSLISAFSNFFITIPLGLLGLNAIGLYLSSVVSLIFINIHMLRKVNPFFKRVSISDIFHVFKIYRRFIIYQYPSNLIGTSTRQFPNQLIANNFGSNALGTYVMCTRVFGLPLSLIATPIQTVYFRFASQKFIEGASDLADFTYSIVTKILLFLFIPLVIGMAFGREIFVFILGDQWAQSGTIASILGLQYVFEFAYNCVTYCRVSINKQNVNLYTSILQVILIFFSLLFGYYYFKSLIGTVLCFSIANLFFNIINISINFICLRKNVVRFSVFSIVYCLGCGFLVWILRLLVL